MKKIIMAIFIAIMGIGLVACDIEDTPDVDPVVETITLTINFDNGLENQIVEIEKGQAYTFTAPEKENYTFLGWFNGEVEYTDETIFNEDVEVVAKWEKNGGGEENTDPDTPLEPSKPLEVPESIHIAWEGGTTTNLDNETNHIKLNYNESFIKTTTNFVGKYSNGIGLNKDGTIRLYGNTEDGNGSELKIEVTDIMIVNKLEINFAKAGSAAKSNAIEIIVNGKTIEIGDLDFLNNNTLTVEVDNIRTIQIINQDTANEEGNGQIWLQNIQLFK